MNSVEAIQSILNKNSISTQEELRSVLSSQGFDFNQSTISRALRRLSVVRVMEQGKKVYRLPEWDAPPSVEASLGDLLVAVEAGEHMVVAKTKPGSASLIARHIDHYLQEFVLGTLAGDDTIFATPRKGVELEQVVGVIKQALQGRN